jgi:hypothetical protein
MLYKPKTGAMWDPSALWHDGKYHVFMMYDKEGERGLDAEYCFLASSTDGVHWRDEGIVVEERERARGAKFFKMFVSRCGDRFVMDHGVLRPEGQDTLRFYESRDLKKWNYLFSNRPDPKWYVSEGRWDHMYILPKTEGEPKAGYFGYVVATPKPGLPSGLGMMQSVDGADWEILPPPEIEWGDTPQRGLEYGGCERIGGKYCLIGGTGDYMGNKGYSMFTLVGDGPRGPFRPDVEAYRLCGATSKNVTWLAAWARGKDELLVSNYASLESGTWMLPLRKPVVDKDGHLRLGWWAGNEALKGKPLAISEKRIALTARGGTLYGIAYLANAFDLDTGVVLEGRIQAPVSPPQEATGENAPDAKPGAGFVVDEGAGQAMAILFGVGKPEGRESHIGSMTADVNGKMTFRSLDVTGKGCATVTGIERDKEHAFRLLLRLDAVELYVDDMLVQTYVYAPGSGKVGFLARNADAVFSNLKAWDMSLLSDGPKPETRPPCAPESAGREDRRGETSS